MAKKQVKNAVPTVVLASWEEVNLSLKRLGELTVQKRELENQKTELVSEITAKFDANAAPLLSEIEELNSSIGEFATSHKDEFVKDRSKELSHGSISMRVSTSVKIISKAICLKVLKAMGMADFINVTEAPNKDMLKALSDIELAKLSCQRQTVDNITITPKIEEIIPNPTTPVAHDANPAYLLQEEK